MGADDTNLVPPGHRFDVVWRGYHRRQVKEYIDFELRMLTADRDAALGMVCELAHLLDESRTELSRLRERFDALCRAPLSPHALGDRLRRVVELARAEASDIVIRARVRAEHVRRRSTADIQRREARAERRRRLIEEDFEIAMAARRAAALRGLREHEAACRAEADRLVREASENAARRIASATARVASLEDARRHLAHQLRLARGLFLRTYALVDPLDGNGNGHALGVMNGTAGPCDGEPAESPVIVGKEAR